jgi:hypothetical protein
MVNTVTCEGSNFSWFVFSFFFVCLSSDFELTPSFVQSLLVARLFMCMFMRENCDEIMRIVFFSQKYAGVCALMRENCDEIMRIVFFSQKYVGELDCALMLFAGYLFVR